MSGSPTYKCALAGIWGLPYRPCLVRRDVIDAAQMSSARANLGGAMEDADLKLKLLEARRERIAARIQRLRGRANAEERKRDTRRKILAGAYLIRLMGGDLKRVGLRLREAGYLEKRDAGLFCLDPDKAES